MPSILVRILLAPTLLSACAAAPQTPPAALSFVCGPLGKVELELRGERARLRTAGETFDLRRRPSSFTRHYASAEMSFIQDGADAVLSTRLGSVHRCRAG